MPQPRGVTVPRGNVAELRKRPQTGHVTLRWLSCSGAQVGRFVSPSAMVLPPIPTPVTSPAPTPPAGVPLFLRSPSPPMRTGQAVSPGTRPPAILTPQRPQAATFRRPRHRANGVCGIKHVPPRYLLGKGEALAGSQDLGVGEGSRHMYGTPRRRTQPHRPRLPRFPGPATGPNVLPRAPETPPGKERCKGTHLLHPQRKLRSPSPALTFPPALRGSFGRKHN